LEIPVVEKPLIIGSRRVNKRKRTSVFRFGQYPRGNSRDEPGSKKGKVGPGGGKKRTTKKTKHARKNSRKYKKK
jgi:hypothetical protein